MRKAINELFPDFTQTETNCFSKEANTRSRYLTKTSLHAFLFHPNSLFYFGKQEVTLTAVRTKILDPMKERTQLINVNNKKTKKQLNLYINLI